MNTYFETCQETNKKMAELHSETIANMDNSISLARSIQSLVSNMSNENGRIYGESVVDESVFAEANDEYVLSDDEIVVKVLGSIELGLDYDDSCCWE